MPPPAMKRPIPILLLKTRSIPHDTYEEHFQIISATNAGAGGSSYSFAPQFIPVLEHTRNEASLSELGALLRSRRLKQRYGGMIFTSQRAVEAWADLVKHVSDRPSSISPSPTEPDAFADIDSLTPFALYSVGPATSRALQHLVSSAGAASPFTLLNPSIHGTQTGNGANLASFILQHYNYLHGCHWFEYFEAPRLPFIPLLGMSSQNYGRKRLERDDPRLAKKSLLFLVGEVRRDIIPKTLSNAEDPDRIVVDEVEVYRTEVMKSFEADLQAACNKLDTEVQSESSEDLRAVVVFSPQGSDATLRRIGYLDSDGKPTANSSTRWHQQRTETKSSEQVDYQTKTKWILVTIGPTTRDYLKDKLGVEPDVCAEQPSPEGLKKGIEDFLTRIGRND